MIHPCTRSTMSPQHKTCFFAGWYFWVDVEFLHLLKIISFHPSYFNDSRFCPTKIHQNPPCFHGESPMVFDAPWRHGPMASPASCSDKGDWVGVGIHLPLEVGMTGLDSPNWMVKKMNEISMVIMNMESYCWVWVTFKHRKNVFKIWGTIQWLEYPMTWPIAMWIFWQKNHMCGHFWDTNGKGMGFLWWFNGDLMVLYNGDLYIKSY